MKSMIKQQTKYDKTERIFTCGKKMLPYVLKKEDIIHILGKVTDAKLAMVIFIGCFQGLRIGEIVRLKWDDVDLDNGEMIVRDAKNTKRYKSGYGKDRKVPINDMFIPTYRKWRSLSPKDHFVIPSQSQDRKAKTMIRYFQELFSEALSKAGLQEVAYYQNDGKPRYKYHLHTLRHVCGTNLYRAGLDIYQVKKFLGHEDIETTQIYCELAIDDLRYASNMAYAYPKSRLSGIEAPVIEINVSPEQLQLQKEILERQLELAKTKQVIEVHNHGYMLQQEVRD